MPACSSACWIAHPWPRVHDEAGLPVAVVEVARSDRPVGSTRGTYQRRRIRSDGKPECAPFLAHEMITRSSDLGQLDYQEILVQQGEKRGVEYVRVERRGVRVLGQLGRGVDG